MRRLSARLLHLFVDSPLLAGGALLCVLACAALHWAGLPASWSGWLLLSALVATLALSVRHGLTKR